MRCHVISNTLRTEIVFTFLVHTLARLSDQILTHSTLKLFEDIFHGTKVGYSRFGEIEIRATFLGAAMHLVATMFTNKFFSSSISCTKLAFELIVLALFDIMRVHLLLDNVIGIT